ncbi:MAG: hypothetical protein RLZZ214_2331 [Verrucomicrobiota bacterium]|jgi:hypothetical protein
MRHPIDLDYVSKAIVGIASPVVGVITSLQEQIEWHLRVASLCVGLAVGIMSLAAMVRKWRGKQRVKWNRSTAAANQAEGAD